MTDGGGRQAVGVVITGRVQGVSFRYHTRQQALSLGVRGWVRNLPDGSVQAHVQGEPAAVERVLAWMAHGPAGAQVDGLVSAPALVDETLVGFDVRR